MSRQDTQGAAEAPWTARVLTVFPEMFPGPLGESLAGRALARGDWRLTVHDIRDAAEPPHRRVDDAPFGGGPGMVMRPSVADRAIRLVEGLEAGRHTLPLIYLTPRGRPLDQTMVAELAAGEGVILLCGRYEGVDERVLEAHGAIEVSLGDFVLSGGEPAALCLIDAVVRLLPGVMGNQTSAGEESFANGLLEYPHYTRPAEWTGSDGIPRRVPDVLLSGHHAEVGAWRLSEAETTTRIRRPDLWARYMRSQADAMTTPNPAPARRPAPQPAQHSDVAHRGKEPAEAPRSKDRQTA